MSAAAFDARRRRAELEQLRRRPLALAVPAPRLPCAAHGRLGWEPCRCWRYRSEPRRSR
jgi:hypothetical protein